MKRILKYASDIHLEMSKDIETLPHVASLYNFTPLENHRYFLVLSGDIGSVFTPALHNFLWKVSQKYEHVFFISGNHEYYNIQGTPAAKPKTMGEIDSELEKICGQLGNVHFMNNKTFQLDEFKIIGSTLWSYVPEQARTKVSMSLNDYRLIGINDPITRQQRQITVADTNTLHKKAVQFIEKELHNASNCIVLTHHAPLYSMPRENKYLCEPHYLNDDINSAFHSDLNYLVKPPALLWIFGHTHYTTKFIHNGVVIAANQVGYDPSPYHYQVSEEIVLGYAPNNK